MKAVGRLLLFFISFTGMTLTDDEFSEENKKLFLTYLFNEHYLSRMNLFLPEISRTIFMDNIAETVLDSRIFDIENYGVNYYLDKYDNETKLSPELAPSIFTEWSDHDHTKVDSADPTHYKGDGKEPIIWRGTKHIGLAIGRDDDYFSVVVLYSPRYKTRTQGQSKSNDSDNIGASTS